MTKILQRLQTILIHSVFNTICAVFRTQRTLHFVTTFPLFRFTAYRHVLLIYFVICSLYSETTGAGNVRRKLTKKTANVPVRSAAVVHVANSNILPKKREINDSISRIIADKNEKFCSTETFRAVFGEGFA